jgi:hydroxypyruvate isomerase
MSGPRYPLACNVSIMFPELPFLERFAAAAAAGFASTEAWWPWATATPSTAELDAFQRAVDDSGIPLTGMNLWAGDMPAGDRGMVSRPDRAAEFEAGLDLMVRIAHRNRLRGANALYGQRQPELRAEEQDAAAIVTLRHAAERLADAGTVVLVEPLARGLNGAYPLETAADGVAVVERAREGLGSGTIGLLLDTFHLASNGEDLVEVVDRCADLIEHVQLADSPGRGEPGSGTIDVPAVIAALADRGYAGGVALEYKPTRATVDTLGWIASIPELALPGAGRADA